jgi:hypothetical protein
MVGITLKQNHRDSIVEELIEIYEDAAERGIMSNSSGTSGKSKK